MGVMAPRWLMMLSASQGGVNNKSAKSVEMGAVAIVAAQVSYAMNRAYGAFTFGVEDGVIKRISFIYFMWRWPAWPS